MKWTGFVARATASRTLLCEQIGYGWDMIWDRRLILKKYKGLFVKNDAGRPLKLVL
jgi:hypothetical protein